MCDIIYSRCGRRDVTCHRWALGWGHSRIQTGAHGCTPPGAVVSSGAANTGPG